MKKRWISLLLLFAVFFCAACAKNSASMREEATAMAAPAAEAPMMAMEDAAYDLTGSAMQFNSGAGEAKAVPEQNMQPEYGGRKIIRTMSLELRSDKFDEHLAQIKKDVQTAGGYMQSSYIYGTKPEVAGDSGRTASFSVRIPVEQVDAFVNAASKYGTLISQNEDTQDVTDSYFDIETRLEVNKQTLERLKSILAKTETMEDIVALEKEISRVTLEIEDLTTNLRKYDGLIQFATVNISLYEEGMKIGPAAKTPFGQRVSDGFRETMSDVGNFLEDLAVLVLAGLPIILPVALIVWLIFYLSRRSLKKDIENGMPQGLRGRQRRWWRQDQRLNRQGASTEDEKSTENKNPEAEK